MRVFYIMLLTLGAVFVLPSLAYATPELPSVCSGTITDYNIVDVIAGNVGTNQKDFIFAGNNNSINVNGGNGGDCILIGNNNTVEIKGGNGVDIIIIGYDNTGAILGSNGADTIIIGYGNTGTIDGENGPDAITTIPRVPLASPVSGIYTSIQHVAITSDGASSVHYTTDNTTPDCSSSTYAEPISVFSTKTIKAVGCSADSGVSAVAMFTYTIELKTDSADLSSILEAVFMPASGASLSLTASLTVSQDLEINTTASGSKIVLDEATVITRADGQDLNASALTSSETDVGSLAGLTEGRVIEGALQWGIPNITLQFSVPITISIFVGADLNGQTLNIARSATGTSGWTSDGIVSPATCVVSDGICSFRATKASYYATYTVTPPVQTSNSGGGGGTIWFPQLYNPAPGPNDIKPVESIPTPPEPAPNPTSVAVVPVPRKTTQIAVAVAKKTQEPTKIVEQPQQPKTVKKNLLSNILASFLGLFRWPF